MAGNSPRCGVNQRLCVILLTVITTFMAVRVMRVDLLE